MRRSALADLVVPLPVKYHLLLRKTHSVRARDGSGARRRYAEQVRTALADLIQQGLARRRHVFWQKAPLKPL